LKKNFLENDIGNAERFVQRHAKDTAYVTGVGFLNWDGKRFKADPEDLIAKTKAQAVAKRIFKEAAELDDPDAAKKRAAWAAKSGQSSRLEAMLREAKPMLCKPLNRFDSHPDLLNVDDGVINLRTGEFGPHDPSLCLTKLAPVKYRAPIKEKIFEPFLQQIQPDAERRELIKRYVGYSATGHTGEQVFAFFWGGGSNGKSTVNEAIRRVLGDYCATMPFGALLHDSRRGNGASPELARLPGTRLTFSGEPDPGSRFSESTIKQLTGADTIAARHLHRGYFDFQPEFKMLVSGNDKPAIRGQDEGMWRRVLLVPFDEYIPPEKRDRELPKKLEAASTEILHWIVEGAAQWYRNGLNPPESVLAAIAEYRNQNDTVQQFLDEMVEPDLAGWVSSGRLYNAYQEWCGENGYQSLGGKNFAQSMGKKGFCATKNNRGDRGRSGLRLMAG